MVVGGLLLATFAADVAAGLRGGSAFSLAFDRQAQELLWLFRYGGGGLAFVGLFVLNSAIRELESPGARTPSEVPATEPPQSSFAAGARVITPDGRGRVVRHTGPTAEVKLDAGGTVGILRSRLELAPHNLKFSDEWQAWECIECGQLRHNRELFDEFRCET
jgi:hypothetical protein